MEITKPVAKPRPVRGRELKTMGIHNAPEDEKDKGEVYYEGYIDGKRYVVPDSNLEAMKDMINLSMRRRKSSRFKHQTSYEFMGYDRFKQSLKDLLVKVDDIPSITTTLSTLSIVEDEDEEEAEDESEGEDEDDNVKTDAEEEPTTSEDEKEKQSEDEKESISNKTEPETKSIRSNKTEPETKSTISTKTESENKSTRSNKTEPETKSLRSEKKKSIDSKKTLGDKQKSIDPDAMLLPRPLSVVSRERESLLSKSSKQVRKPSVQSRSRKPSSSALRLNGAGAVATETGEYRIRFLISGHFHAGETPMFIIQEYQAESGVFDDQKVDIRRVQSVGDVDINIVGKFYNESIIEEHRGTPRYLNIKPQKIEIDRLTSKIFYDYFEENFKMENFVDILINGHFITSKVTKDITPKLSFRIKKRNAASNISFNSVKKDRTPAKNRNPFMVKGTESVVNFASFYNTNIVGMGYNRDSTDLKNVDKLKANKKGSSSSRSPEGINKRHSSSLYPHLPLIPRALQNSFAGYKPVILEVSSDSTYSQNSSQIVRRSKRKVMNDDDVDNNRKTDMPKGEEPLARISTQEYVCRIQDYRPTKRKFFNLF